MEVGTIPVPEMTDDLGHEEPEESRGDSINDEPLALTAILLAAGPEPRANEQDSEQVGSSLGGPPKEMIRPGGVPGETIKRVIQCEIHLIVSPCRPNYAGADRACAGTARVRLIAWYPGKINER